MTFSDSHTLQRPLAGAMAADDNACTIESCTSKKESISSVDRPKNLILKSVFSRCQTGLLSSLAGLSSPANPSSGSPTFQQAKKQPISNTGLAPGLDPDVRFQHISPLAASAKSGRSGFSRQAPLVPVGPLPACRRSAGRDRRAGTLAWEHQKHQNSKLYSAALEVLPFAKGVGALFAASALASLARTRP